MSRLLNTIKQETNSLARRIEEIYQIDDVLEEVNTLIDFFYIVSRWMNARITKKEEAATYFEKVIGGFIRDVEQGKEKALWLLEVLKERTAVIDQARKKLGKISDLRRCVDAVRDDLIKQKKILGQLLDIESAFEQNIMRNAEIKQAIEEVKRVTEHVFNA